MLENYDVHHYTVYWKKEEQFLVLGWDMKDLYTLIPHTMVNKVIFLKVGENSCLKFV